MSRYRKCRLWKGGHRWSEWSIEEVEKLTGEGFFKIKHHILMRTCENCKDIQTKEM